MAGANRALFCSKLVDDTRLLEKLNLMDYSLLVAVYDAKDVRCLAVHACMCRVTLLQIPEDFDASFDPYFLTAPNAGDHVYCVGIIDALTVYTTKKKAAHAAKAARLGVSVCVVDMLCTNVFVLLVEGRVFYCEPRSVCKALPGVHYIRGCIAPNVSAHMFT